MSILKAQRQFWNKKTVRKPGRKTTTEWLRICVF